VLVEWPMACLNMKLARPLLPLLAVTLVGACAAIPRGGVVYEIRSKQPIAGAAVEVECRQYQLHGTRLIRTARRDSASDGKYQFDAADVSDCDVILAHVSKEGYVDASQILDSAIKVPFVVSSAVPSFMYLSAADDVHRLRLEGLLIESKSEIVWATPDSEAWAAFVTIHQPFLRSRYIATTPEERAWVRDRYCARLEQRWEALTADKRAEAAKLGYADWPKELAAFCTGTSDLSERPG